MKYILISIALIFSNLLAFSQVPDDAVSFEDPNFGEYLKTRKIPTVKGKISNISPEEIKNVSISYTLVTILGGEQKTKNASIGSDGSFNLELENNLPYQQIWLGVGEQYYAGIYAHSELFIELDWQKAKEKEISMNGDGVKYLGTDGEMNNYLNNFVLFEQKTNKNNTPQDYIKQNPSKYSWIIENENASKILGAVCTQDWLLQKMDNDLWTKVNNHKSYIVSNYGMMFYKYLHHFISIKETGRVIGHDHTNFYLKYFCQNDKEKAELISLTDVLANTSPKDSVLYAANESKFYSYIKTIERGAETRVLYPRLMTFIDSAFTQSKTDFLKLHDSWQRQDIKIRKKKIEIALASMKSGWSKDFLTTELQNTLNKIKEIDELLIPQKSIRATAPN
jgi:hypothetical protein